MLKKLFKNMSAKVNQVLSESKKILAGETGAATAEYAVVILARNTLLTGIMKA